MSVWTGSKPRKGQSGKWWHISHFPLEPHGKALPHPYFWHKIHPFGAYSAFPRVFFSDLLPSTFSPNDPFTRELPIGITAEVWLAWLMALSQLEKMLTTMPQYKYVSLLVPACQYDVLALHRPSRFMFPSLYSQVVRTTNPTLLPRCLKHKRKLWGFKGTKGAAFLSSFCSKWISYFCNTHIIILAFTANLLVLTVLICSELGTHAFLLCVRVQSNRWSNLLR